MINLSKKIAMIIAFEGFRDEEYAEPKAVFEKTGIEVTTFSTQTGTAKGKISLTAKVDLTLDQLNVSDYNAVLFIGGPGSFALYNDVKAHKIAQDAAAQGKILGAICAASGILAHAGVLKGKKATMFDDTGVLAQFGATYTGTDVETDGKIITATGPQTAKAWAEAIVKNGKF